jgi:hypothetical protein
MEMVPLSQKSLLCVDQFSRTEAAKKWHNTKREMVISDTTLETSLATFYLKALRSIGVDSYRSLKCANALSLTLYSEPAYEGSGVADMVYWSDTFYILSGSQWLCRDENRLQGDEADFEVDHADNVCLYMERGKGSRLRLHSRS